MGMLALRRFGQVRGMLNLNILAPVMPAQAGIQGGGPATPGDHANLRLHEDRRGG